MTGELGDGDSDGGRRTNEASPRLDELDRRERGRELQLEVAWGQLKSMSVRGHESRTR